MEIMPRAHLVDCQGNNGSMSDTVESHLPGTHGDILEMGHQHAALGILGIGCVIRCQLEGLQLLCQSYNKEERGRQEEISKTE